MEKRRDLWLLFVLLGSHFYLLNEFRAFANPNVHSRVYLTLAIVDHHTLAIDDCIARYGPVQDVAAHADRTFSDKPPGYSVMLAPLAWLLRHTVATGADARGMAIWLRILGVSLPAVLFWYLTRGYWIELAGDRRLGLAVVMAGALGTNFFIYATQLFSHALAGMLLFLAYRAASGRSFGQAARCGLLLALAFSIDYITAPAVLVLLVFAITIRNGARWRGTAALLVAAMPVAALWMIYNQLCFGSPVRFSYLSHAAAEYRPLIDRGWFGMYPPRLEGLLGLTVLPPHGIAVLSPFLLLAPLGWWRMRNSPSERGCALACAATFITTALFAATLVDWRGGWSVSARYLTPTIPLLLVGVAAAIRPANARATRIAFRAGAALGILQVALIAVTFPDCAPTFHDPPYDMAIPLLRAGCVNGAIWDSSAPPAAMLPFASLMLGVASWIILPARWLGAAVVAVTVTGQVFIGLHLDYARRLMVADAMWRMGYVCKSDAARAQLHAETLSKDPKNVFDLTELAWLRAASPCDEVRNANQAIELAERLSQIVGEERPGVLDLRGAACAEAGRFDQATAFADRAVRIAEQTGDRAMVDQLQSKRAAYQRNRPWRRPAVGR